MSETVLAPLVLKLDTLTLQHTKIKAYVKKARDLVEELRCYLRRVDSDEEHDLEVEVWTNKVRCATYELEDVIDKFKPHLAPRSSSFKNFVAQLCIWTALDRFRNKVETIASQFPIASDSFHGMSAENKVPIFEIEGPTLHIKEELVGIEEHTNHLTDMLILGGDDLRVVPVVGMGGLGKTTLVRQVYNHAKVRKHFQTCVWVHVPREFKEKETLKNIIHQLSSQNKQQSHPDQEDQETFKLKKKVHGHLQLTRYVVVLDGLWTMSAWYSIKHAFPDNNYGSRVIITTRSNDVAHNSCKSIKHIYQLPVLPEAESWILFQKKTFVNGSCPTPFKEVSESILKRCFGIPIAIIAIGGMLRSKTNFDEWEAVRRSLEPDEEKVNDESTYKSSYRALLLSYNDLPFHLKACYLYLSMFPEDYLIECARLIRLWVAEGLVEVMGKITPEDVANVYITELLNRSLLQVAHTTSDGRVKACRIPSLLRTIIIMKARETNFTGLGEEHDESWSEEVRRLSVRNNLPSITMTQMQQIRSLLAFDMEGSLTKLFRPPLFDKKFKLILDMEEPLTKIFKPTLFYTQFKQLTVLDLKGADIVDFPTTVVDLPSLRYLSLRGTKVETVPNSIGTLQNLETLDLKYTKVDELPKGIVKLQRLRNLLLYRHKTDKYATFNIKEGFKAPKRVGRLQSLRKLCFIEAGTDSGPETTVSELGKLTQLRRLGIVNLRREQNDVLCLSIKNLGNLQALSVTSSDSEKMDFQHLSPPESLQRLYLIGQLESLPQGFRSLKNLVKIFLKGSMLLDNPLKMLEDLANLVHIELFQAYQGNDLLFKAGSFTKLRILGLNKLESLKRVTVEETSMPNLEKFVLQDCSSLETIPSGVEHLCNLKVFHLIEMPEILVNAVYPPPNAGKSYWKVQNIPEVNATFKNKDSTWNTMRLSPSLKVIRAMKKSRSVVGKNTGLGLSFEDLSPLRKSVSEDTLQRPMLLQV